MTVAGAVALAVGEALLATVFFVGVLVQFYNRWLAGLRESVAKKVMSVGTWPLGTGLGVGAVVLGSWGNHWWGLGPALAGAAVVLVQTVEAIDRYARNSAVVVKRHPAVHSGINWPYYRPVRRAVMRALQPVNGVDDLRVATLEMPLRHLDPAFDGYRLVFLTDFHVHPTLTRAYFFRVVDEAMELEPDAVLVGGDFLSRRWHLAQAEDVIERIAGIGAPTYVVRGNHDFWARPAKTAEIVRHYGMTMLTNDFVNLTRGGAFLSLVGLETPYVPLTARGEGRLRERLDREGTAARVGLVHTPEAYGVAARLGCGFCLAGHTHGGQVRMPLFGTTIAACAAPAPHIWGAGRVDHMRTFTSNGIGAFFPLRVLCPPQIVEVVLRAG